MADLNPIKIEDFPEVTSLLSTDQVILFAEEDEKMYPYVADLSSFTEFVLSAGELAELEKKVTELESYYKEVERTFNNTYVTNAQAKAEYSTKTNYNSVKSKIETIEKFKKDISSKASGEYAESKFSNLKRKIQDMKRFIGSWQWTKKNKKGHSEDGWGYKLLAVASAKKGSFSK